MSIINTMKDENKVPIIVRTVCLYCSSSNINKRTGTCNDCGTTNPGIGSQTKKMRRTENAVPSKDNS